jgi:hypothetical protein
VSLDEVHLFDDAVLIANAVLLRSTGILGMREDRPIVAVRISHISTNASAYFTKSRGPEFLSEGLQYFCSSWTASYIRSVDPYTVFISILERKIAIS